MYLPLPSVTYSKPSATLLQGSNELVCLVFGFSPVSINITWFLDQTKELLNYNTTEPHKGLDGKFSIQSHLHLSNVTWLPGAVITCRVTHENISLIRNVTKQGIGSVLHWLFENHIIFFQSNSINNSLIKRNYVADTLERCNFLDEILYAEVYQDIGVDGWYVTLTFLLLFLISVFYGVGATLIKVRYCLAHSCYPSILICFCGLTHIHMSFSV